MKNTSYYLGSLIISVAIVTIGILVYHNYINKPIIIFQDGIRAEKVSSENVFGLNEFPDFALNAEKNLPAIVYINTIRKDNEGMYTNSSGSGICISPNGQIVTNMHVVADAERILVTTYENKNYEAKLIGKDEYTDIAVLKIEEENSEFVFFGNSDALKIGEWIMVIGNPFKLRNSVSAGLVSAKNRTLNILGNNSVESYIQTDAIANPGNSGGAMLNNDGKLVGMISAITTNSGSFQGYSFAIPSNIVKKVASDIINYGVVQRAWLGVSIKNVEGESGVEIERVNMNSAADQSGLIRGDKIFIVDGVNIVNVAQFEGVISRYKPGDVIKIEFKRNNEIIQLKATLKNNLNTTELIANRNDDILIDLGFVLRDLTSNEKLELGGSGVMVVSVIRDSKIDKINIEPGYIIKSINGEKILNVSSFINKIERSSEKIQLKGIYKSYPGVFPYVFEK